MVFGLVAYRYHLPLSIRSALAPIFGKRIHGGIGPLSTPETVEAMVISTATAMSATCTATFVGMPKIAALMGMVFGLVAYRYHLPLSIRSALAPIFGKRIHGGSATCTATFVGMPKIAASP
jgi:choline-glycine betaine transporter